MPKLVVLYPPPTDVAAFERAYAEEHAPLVHAQLPSVRRLDAARVVPASRGETKFHWVAELHFDSMAALSEATSSAGGQRLAGHARQISTGGAPLMLVVEDPTVT
jgi:uncharacterized protein (TIGR02118 family)